MRRISRTPRSTQQHGDVTAIDRSYPYTDKKYVDRRGHAVVEWWVIHGLGHTYPNGDTRSTYTDPKGPDITAGAWRFFTATSRTR
jgi:poly(3-hydroxybutyrate) depolymerase